MDKSLSAHDNLPRKITGVRPNIALWSVGRLLTTCSKNSEDEKAEYLENEESTVDLPGLEVIGSSVKLQVTSVGRSEKAYAAVVEGKKKQFF